MSKKEDKFRASKRRYNDDVAIKRQIKILKGYGHPIKEPHRYNKHHAMDCGNPRCCLCGNPRHNKSFKKKDKLTMQEKKFFQNYKDNRL